MHQAPTHFLTHKPGQMWLYGQSSS